LYLSIDIFIKTSYTNTHTHKHTHTHTNTHTHTHTHKFYIIGILENFRRFFLFSARLIYRIRHVLCYIGSNFTNNRRVPVLPATTATLYKYISTHTPTTTTTTAYKSLRLDGLRLWRLSVASTVCALSKSMLLANIKKEDEKNAKHAGNGGSTALFFVCY